jgi:serine/threonine protein phosphatase 1
MELFFMSLIKVWDKPITGNVYVVGDIHGCYNLLMNHLNTIGFDFKNDLLIAVGDLVDRGVQNLECVSLLDETWFTSIRGNHEELCIHGRYDQSYKDCHISNGGQWFYDLDQKTQHKIAEKFTKLPVVLEVNHGGKKYGFVHGHIEQNDWEQFKASFKALYRDNPTMRDPFELALWGRDRIDTDNKKYTHVTGVDQVFMGHTVVLKPFKRDNCYYIDTGAVHYGVLGLFKLN